MAEQKTLAVVILGAGKGRMLPGRTPAKPGATVELDRATARWWIERGWAAAKDSDAAKDQIMTTDGPQPKKRGSG